MSKPGTLVIDVGGNNVKLICTGLDERRKAPSGPDFTPKNLVAAVRALTADLDFERISIGLPTPVRANSILKEPHNLGGGWVGVDLAKVFGRPTKVVNDAVMQAMGSYQGGTQLFLGLFSCRDIPPH